MAASSDNSGQPNTSLLQLALIGGLLMAVLSLYLLRGLFFPEIKAVEFAPQFPGVQLAVPLVYPDDLGGGVADIKFNVSRMTARKYQAYVDDCIDQMWVNGSLYVEIPSRLCTVLHTMSLDFSNYLREGENTIRVSLLNKVGPGIFSIRPAPDDQRNRMLLAAIAAGLVGWYLAGSLIIYHRLRWSPLLALFTAGALLRVAYLFQTPYWSRSYDWAGHIEYVQYLLDFHRLPDPKAGWQLHNPPLYYLLCWVWALMSLMPTSLSPASLLEELQFVSCIISCASLAVLAWIGSELFAGSLQKTEKGLFAALMAFFPGLVFFSSRISNDTLQQLLSFLFLLGLIKFWRQPTRLVWSMLIVISSLGVLTKLSFPTLVPIAFVLLFLARGISLREKLLLCSAGLIFFAFSLGWYLHLRIFSQELFFIDNSERNLVHPGLNLGIEARQFMTFNPLEILRHPYNSTWVQESRREFFFEFLYRSAFFGEFKYPPSILPLSLGLLAGGLPVLFFALLGLGCSLRFRFKEDLPLLLCGAASLAGLLWYRLHAPNSSNQDFRFISMILPVLAYYALSPGLSRPAKLWPVLQQASVLVLSLFSLLFVALFCA